jgi:hypothetical protein
MLDKIKFLLCERLDLTYLNYLLKCKGLFCASHRMDFVAALGGDTYLFCELDCAIKSKRM